MKSDSRLSVESEFKTGDLLRVVQVCEREATKKYSEGSIAMALTNLGLDVEVIMDDGFVGTWFANRFEVICEGEER